MATICNKPSTCSGGSTPVPCSGGSTPVPCSGGSTPVPCSGGSTPVPCSGGSTPVPCTHTHNYNTLIGSMSPTCTKSGYNTLKCSCGATTTQTIPATGIHVYGTSWTNYSETLHMQVCLTCGGAPKFEAHVASGTCKCGKVITIPVKSVTISNGGGSLEVGQTRTLTGNVLPCNATNKAVTWSSSNTSVATVSCSGVVTAKAAGTATITVRTNDGGYTSSKSIIGEIPVTKVGIIIK